MSKQNAGKLVPLEGLRGIAAIIVMLGHLVRGLVPPGAGPLDALNLVHQWFLNGGAAVSVFFVLSGFILSLPFAKDQDWSRILTALFKRWPRLAALTTIACLFSWVMIVLSHGDYQQAAAITGNHWMASHFNSPLHGRDVSWVAALRSGLYGVFLFGDVHFDSPLWTMRIELFGSFAIFFSAPVLFRIGRWPLRVAVIVALMLAAGLVPPLTFFSDFLVGAMLAMLYADRKFPDLSNGLAVVGGLAGVYLFCFSAGPAAILEAPLKAILPDGNLAHFVWDASAAVIIIVLLGNPAARGIFSKRWAVWLGRLSFPLYLLHVPIMLSIGAASIIFSVGALGMAGAVLLSAAVTLGVSLACALPLAWVDMAWTGALRTMTGILIKRRPA